MGMVDQEGGGVRLKWFVRTPRPGGVVVLARGRAGGGVGMLAIGMTGGVGMLATKMTGGGTSATVTAGTCTRGGA